MSNKWPTARLGEVLTPTGRVESVDVAKEYRLLGVRLDGNGPFLRETVTGTQTAATKLFRVSKGDFIYSRLFACRAAFGVIDEELDGCFVSSEFPTFVPLLEKIDVNYLKYWFRLPAVIARVDADCTGSTPLTRNRFKENFFLALEIPLPPLSEQSRIVACIEELAAQISQASNLRKEAAEEAYALMTARISALFDDDRYWKRVADAVSTRRGAVRSGPFGSQLHHEEFIESGVAAIGTRDVQTNRFQLKSGWFVSRAKFDQFRRYQVFSGDVLCTIVGASIGRFCVVPEIVPLAFTTKHIQALTLDSTKADARFASWMLNFHRRSRESLFSQVEGSAQPSLNAGKILGTALPLPSISEQRRIVSELDSFQAQVDKLKHLQEETSKELDELLPSILDKAFKGEL